MVGVRRNVKLKKMNIHYDVLHPSYKAIYELVGEEGMMKIYYEFRGTALQLPMKLYDRTKTAEKFEKMDSKTNDVIKLSHEYGYSQRWTKKMLDKGKE